MTTYSNPNSAYGSATGTSPQSLAITTPTAGQLLVASILLDSGTGSNNISTPSGWTICPNSSGQVTSGWWVKTFYKKAAGTETSVSFTFTGGGSYTAYMLCQEFDGFNGTPTIDPNISAEETGTAATSYTLTPAISHLPTSPSLSVCITQWESAASPLISGTSDTYFVTYKTNTSTDATKFAYNLYNPTSGLAASGWVQDTGDNPSATTSTAVATWTTSATVSMTLVNFYDPNPATPAAPTFVPRTVASLRASNW